MRLCTVSRGTELHQRVIRERSRGEDPQRVERQAPPGGGISSRILFQNWGDRRRQIQKRVRISTGLESENIQSLWQNRVPEYWEFWLLERSAWSLRRVTHPASAASVAWFKYPAKSSHSLCDIFISAEQPSGLHLLSRRGLTGGKCGWQEYHSQGIAESLVSSVNRFLLRKGRKNHKLWSPLGQPTLRILTPSRRWTVNPIQHLGDLSQPADRHTYIWSLINSPNIWRELPTCQELL